MNVIQLLSSSLSACFTWMEQFNFYGISVLQVSVFAFLISCLWRFILSPIFGHSGFSVPASGMVKKLNSKDKNKGK